MKASAYTPALVQSIMEQLKEEIPADMLIDFMHTDLVNDPDITPKQKANLIKTCVVKKMMPSEVYARFKNGEIDGNTAVDNFSKKLQEERERQKYFLKGRFPEFVCRRLKNLVD